MDLMLAELHRSTKGGTTQGKMRCLAGEPLPHVSERRGRPGHRGSQSIGLIAAPRCWAQLELEEKTMANSFFRAAVIALAASTLLAGCASYYRVTDPGSGRQYYTTNVEKSKDGSVSFKDTKSGSAVTLQSSEVTEISHGDYEAGVKK
jgi:hypothetical protein